mgnify:FL=1
MLTAVCLLGFQIQQLFLQLLALRLQEFLSIREVGFTCSSVHLWLQTAFTVEHNPVVKTRVQLTIWLLHY